MDIQQFAASLQKKAGQLRDLWERKMPVLVGRMAKDHFQDNFRKGGFVNNGLTKWTPAKRLGSGSSSASANYGTLFSSRNHLFNSVDYTPTTGRVRVFNDAVHAPVHNFGETVQPTVTPRMRRFAWAKYYEAVGGSKSAGHGAKKGKGGTPRKESDEVKFWKNFALTRKKKLSIKMPARPFLGQSAELDDMILQKQETEIRNVLDS